MRQVKSLALMTIVLLLLTACGEKGSKAENELVEIRTRLIAAETFYAELAITADYGERVYEYGITYSGSPGLGALTVNSPAELAGVRASVSVTGGTLHYDGAELDTGPITADGLSPVEAVPVLMQQWQRGEVEQCALEKYGEADAVMMSTSVNEAVTQCTWFDRETGNPLYSELLESGRAVIKCEFSDVVIAGG